MEREFNPELFLSKLPYEMQEMVIQQRSDLIIPFSQVNYDYEQLL